MSAPCANQGCQGSPTSKWFAINGQTISLCDAHASGLLRAGVITTHSDEGRPRCLFCDKPIEAARPELARPYHKGEVAERKFCSTACFGAYRRAAARTEKIVKTCRYCGAALEPRPDEPFRLFRSRVYCDFACYSAQRAKEKQQRKGLV